MPNFLCSFPLSQFSFHVLQFLRFMTVRLVLSRPLLWSLPARLSVAFTSKFLSAIASDCCDINLGGRLVPRNVLFWNRRKK
ncbi:hypothetical protein ACFX2I_036852 [Malus domestica]